MLGAPTATVVILHVRIELPFTVSPVTGFPATVKPNLITLAASAFGATQMTLRLRGYDEENDRLLFTTELDGARHLVSYSAETGIVWCLIGQADAAVVEELGEAAPMPAA